MRIEDNDLSRSFEDRRKKNSREIGVRGKDEKVLAKFWDAHSRRAIKLCEDSHDSHMTLRYK